MVLKKNAAALRAGLVVGAFALLAAAGGCGGGSDDPAETVDNADYYPLNVGDRRVFRTTYSWGPFGEHTTHDAETVIGTRDVGGMQHFIVRLEDADGDSELLAHSSATAVNVRDPADPAAQMDLLRFPATTGESFTQDLGPYGIDDVDGDGTRDTATTRYVTTPVDVTTVQTPAGRFERSLRVHSDVTLTVRRSSDGRTESSTSSTDTWYAPGVGRVRVSEMTDDLQMTVELVTFLPAAQPRMDKFAPELLSTSPEAGTTTHPGASLRLSFDEPVTTASVRRAVTVTNGLGEAVALYQEGPWDKTGREVVLTPMGWSAGTYTVHFAAGITDLAGNAMAARADRTFTVDGALPAATYTLPRAQVENVIGYEGWLTAYFSTPMDPTTVSFVTLREGSEAVPAAITLSHGIELTVTPATPLKPLTRYTVDLTGLEDLDGVPVANPRNWTFVTGTTVTVGPLQGSTSTVTGATPRRPHAAPRRAARLPGFRAQ